MVWNQQSLFGKDAFVLGLCLPRPPKGSNNGTSSSSPRFPNVVMESFFFGGGGVHFLDPSGGLGSCVVAMPWCLTPLTFSIYIDHDVMHGATFPVYEWQRFLTHPFLGGTFCNISTVALLRLLFFNAAVALKNDQGLQTFSAFWVAMRDGFEFVFVV